MVEPRNDDPPHSQEVVHEHNVEEQEDSRGGTGPEDILDAAVVRETAAHLKEAVAADSCTVAAHPDLPGLRADHALRRALLVVAHSDLADRLGLQLERAHWVRTAPMPGRKLPVTRQDGRGIAD